MRGNQKFAWVTTAMDKGTAMQAAVLGKSLSRVITMSDTVVLIPEDLKPKLQELLAQCFDSVIQVDVTGKHKQTNLSTMDILKMFAINMEMYNKIVLLNPKNLVLQNCDELFKLENDYYITKKEVNQNSTLSPVFVIKPHSALYSETNKLSRSNQFFCFSEVITASLASTGKTEFSELSGVYNADINDFQNNNLLGPLEKLKIASFDYSMKMAARYKNGSINDIPVTNIQEINNFWLSCMIEIKEQLDSTIEIGSSINNLGKKMKDRTYCKDSIAIIGLSCRFPEANNINEFWELLKTGGDGIKSIPVERIENGRLQIDDEKFNLLKLGFLKCPIDEFDAKFFGISPREAEMIDPQQRILLEVAWEALENAAIDPHSLKGGNTGVFTGIWQADYESIVKENTSANAFHNVVLGNSFSATSARISYILGLNGPNIATESGCSSSMVALHLACDSLKKNEMDLGLVMGANLVILKDSDRDFPVFAKDGHCKTFDEKADGFVRAEGIAVIVLKRLSDAIKTGDRIMGIIRGSGISNEGTTSSFGTPSKFCQEIAVRDAIRNSGVRPEEVDYVEAHGTGTPVGDPVEFAALSAVYAGKREKPLVIGSVKTNIGHCESAAGLAGLIKVILSMKHETIPRHRNFDTLNPNINLETIPAVLPLEQQPWKKDEKRVRIAGVSSFGISGTNVHLLVEEPPMVNQYHSFKINCLEDERTHHILNLSAKTENALEDLANSYIKYLKENNDVDIRDLTFTANNGRSYFKHRLSVTGKNISLLAAELQNKSCDPPGLKEPPKIGFLFTGQGSQYPGMAHILYKSNSVFKNAFDECSILIEREIGIDLKKILWDDNEGCHLGQCISSQLSIFSVEYSLLCLLFNLGVKPNFVLGHSLGEYAAAVASGIMVLEDSLKLLITRSQLISKLPPGGMMAITCSVQKGEELISKCSKGNNAFWLDIAVVNSPDEIVVAGNKESLDLFLDLCRNNNIRCKKLEASNAFHSRDIDGVLNAFEQVTSKMKYQTPICQYVSGTTGSILTGDEMNDGSYWLRHAREPVNFQKGIQTLAENGCNVFMEIGPRPVLLALGMVSLTSLKNVLWLPTLQQNKDNWEILLESLGKLYMNGVDINWSVIDTPGNRKKLELPTYPFQRQKYWINIAEKNNQERQIHPLLGKKVSLASIKETIYKNQFSLEDFPYIKDHQVANLVIMPGAGFLEIISAAGRDLLLKDGNSFKTALHIQDFVIEAPLELEEGKHYEMQVVATPLENESNSFKISVFLLRKLNGYNNEKGWKLFSSAIVSVSDYEKIKTEFVRETVESIKSRCPGEKSSHGFYKRVSELGIQFGNAFKSLESLWQKDNESLGLFSMNSFSENLRGYFYHPVLLDAMLQTVGLILMLKDGSGPELPVGISNCFLFSKSLSDVIFAHGHWDEKNNCGTITLYNDKNDVMILMTGVRLIRTSISSFLNNVEGQKNNLPGLYQEIWRSRLGPFQSRIDLTKVPDFKSIMNPLERSMEHHLKSYSPLEHLRNEYIQLKLIKMFHENGLLLEEGREYSTRSIITDNLIVPIHTRFVDRIIDILVEDGFVSRIKENESWNVVKLFPSPSYVEQKIRALKSVIQDSEIFIYELFEKCMDNIWKVFQGQIAPLAALFDRTDINVLDLYTKGMDVILANIRMANILNIILHNIRLSSNGEMSTVRIIEIGGGSAASSMQILKLLQKNGISYHYTFTDISAQFFENATKELSSFENVEYKVLNIEKDPSSQGFCPYFYDVVIASNVIHATQCLNTSIGNTRKLLTSGGLLLLQEMLRPIRIVDMIFGILESYWTFNDYDIRKNHPVVSQQVWDRVLTKNNFGLSHHCSGKDEICTVLLSRATELTSDLSLPSQIKGNNTWLIFCDNGSVHKEIAKKLTATFGNTILINHTNKQALRDDQDILTCHVNMLDESQLKKILDELTESNVVCGVVYLMSLDCVGESCEDEIYIKTLNFCKYFATNLHIKAQILAATRGAAYVTSQQTVEPSCAVIWSMLKSLMMEIPKLPVHLVDLDPDVYNANIEAQEIFSEIFNTDEKFACYRNEKKFVPRITKLREQETSLSFPGGKYKLEVPNTKRIEDLCFKPLRDLSLAPNDVEVLVKAISLNFRDIFIVIKPDGFHSKYDHALGSDYAGIISKVGSAVTRFKMGDEVFGFKEGSSASHVVLNESAVFLKPSHLNFSEAATIPSAYLTAYCCLITIADLKKSETVLIHVASGGVGLFAIQIAQNIGAKIIVTAGSHRKRSYLRSLGLKHVLHSRDLTFGEGIKKATNGQGVDVVLNSLTGPGFKETTLENCGKNARFIEIGKVNTWSVEDIQKLRSDVIYTIFDLEQVEASDVVDIIPNMYNKGMLHPIPYASFQISNIRRAMNYFMKAEHIGKIVCTMPKLLNIGNQLVTKETLFNKNASYLITGGLGGIGLAVAKWMVDSGAECLVLIGRSAPSTEAVLEITKLRNKGCRILTFEVDVGNLRQCQNLFQKISELPPLKGVIHSAGVLSDAVLSNQTWEKYQIVFNAKIRGCLNLHELTKGIQLEHFVLFSSQAANMTGIGQSNHSAANAFLDAFAYYRHSIGLPAQTVNWGLWSEIGSAINSPYMSNDDFGLQSFTPNQGIAALQFLMSRPNLIQLTVSQMNLKNLHNIIALGSYLKEIFVSNEQNASESFTPIHSETFSKDIQSLDLRDRTIYIKKHLVTLLKRTLKLPNGEEINEHQPFSEMGLDSLMSVELRNRLQNMVGDEFSIHVTTLKDYPTISSLSKYLAELRDIVQMETKVAPIDYDRNQVIDLVKQDSLLPDDIIAAESFVNIKNIQNIFLTGVTGHMSGFLLREILKNPRVSVTCLIRASSKDHAHNRLVESLQKIHLLHSVQLDRVSVVVGDIASERLGLPDEDYKLLSENMDAVIHFAVNGSHVERYQIDLNSKSDIRSVNVLGTINILRFAANIRTKRVYYSSSIAAVNRLSDQGFAYEDFPDDDNNADEITIDYALTKFVCEKLMKQAISRGIPCVVIRYPVVIGNSVSGSFTVDSELSMNLLLMVIKLGLVIDSEGGWAYLSADNAAELTAELIFNDSLESGMYNMWQPEILKISDFVEIVKSLGCQMKCVSEEEFFQKMEQQSTNSFFYYFKETYGSDFLSVLYKNNFIPRRLLLEGNSICPLSQKVLKAIPNVTERILDSRTLIKRCLTYAKTTGIFDTYDIAPLQK